MALNREEDLWNFLADVCQQLEVMLNQNYVEYFESYETHNIQREHLNCLPHIQQPIQQSFTTHGLNQQQFDNINLQVSNSYFPPVQQVAQDNQQLNELYQRQSTELNNNQQQHVTEMYHQPNEMYQPIVECAYCNWLAQTTSAHSIGSHTFSEEARNNLQYLKINACQAPN